MHTLDGDALDFAIENGSSPGKTDITCTDRFERSGNESFIGPDVKTKGGRGQLGNTHFGVRGFDPDELRLARFEVPHEHPRQPMHHVFNGCAAKLGSVFPDNIRFGSTMRALTNQFIERSSSQIREHSHEVDKRFDVVGRRGEKNGIAEKTLDVFIVDLRTYGRPSAREFFLNVFHVAGIHGATDAKWAFAELFVMRWGYERPGVRFHGAGE